MGAFGVNLVFFLLIFCVITLVFGELGKYPFGSSSVAVGILDIGVFLSTLIAVIWKFGIKKDYMLPKGFWILIGFWAIGLLSLIVSGIFWGGFYLIRFVLYSFIFYLGFIVAKEKNESLNTFLKLTVMVGVAHSVLGFWQLVFFPNFSFLTEYGFDPHQFRLASTFLDPNFLGAFLNIAIVCSLVLFWKDKRKVWFVVILLMVAAVVMTFSRSAYLMLITELLVLSSLRMKWFFGVIIVITLILYFASFRIQERVNGIFTIDKTANERILSWQRGFEVYMESPIIGVGFNNLRYAYQQQNLFKSNSLDGGHSGAGVDSSFIFILVTTGFIGFSVYLLWWMEILRIIFLNLKSGDRIYGSGMIAIALGLFVNSQFINSLFYAPIMFIVFLLFGLGYGIRVRVGK